MVSEFGQPRKVGLSESDPNLSVRGVMPVSRPLSMLVALTRLWSETQRVPNASEPISERSSLGEIRMAHGTQPDRSGSVE